MTYKNYGENIRPMEDVKVIFTNYVRLIRLVTKKKYEE